MIIILSIFSGLFYLLTGLGGDGRKSFPSVPGWFFGRQTRLVGCSTCRILAVLVVGVQAPWWCDLLVMGLTVGALSTYWDFLFGFDNFWFHGFMIGVATLPYVFFGVSIWAWLVQAVALAVFMGVLCHVLDRVHRFFGKNYVEEPGRGASIPLSALLLRLFL